ncbi:hypothetical protein FH972_002190 [Carpinus fangiana]|uniref:Uncharacterized protein n=1 Tax=Carpinus fangiana TaxID=176857 RepID=A0A5N6QEG4_9ROSI|nr:hypothetical protein FH972_002190 [Carpinus fangiana]
MSSSVSTTPAAPSSSNLSFFSFHLHHHPLLPFPTSISFPIPYPSPTGTLRLTLCRAANSQTGPVKKRPSNKKKKKSKASGGASEGLNLSDVEVVRDLGVVDNDVDGDDGVEGLSSDGRSLPYQPMPLPKPPAGFVVDDHGRVVMASDPAKRIVTVVDPTNNLPLECVVRRVFRSSQENECMLLCPVDTPVQILKSTNIDGWSAVNDEEVEAILPSAAYALAKIHMHLVHSGFCYTARGGFCYSEDGIFDFRTGNNDGQDIDGLPTEGVEITCFHLDGAHYMIYTPSDPLLFVAVKNQNGVLQIADDICGMDKCLLLTQGLTLMRLVMAGDNYHKPLKGIVTLSRQHCVSIPTCVCVSLITWDVVLFVPSKPFRKNCLLNNDLLEDPAIISAIDEETEFNALVEEESALLESLKLGER